MTKRQLIDEIRQINTSAEEAFLSRFDENVLDQYLRRLKDARARQPRIGGWAHPRPLRKAS
jgi:hypothetical protein